MAADNERRLMSRVIRDRDISLMLERNVDDTWFVNDEDKQVWKFVTRHYAKYSEVPTAVTVLDNYPTYRLLNVQDTAEYLLDQLIAYRRQQAAIRLVEDATEAIENNDHEKALATLAKGISAIGDSGSLAVKELDLTEDPMARFKDYEELKARGGGLLGIPTGFSTIDLATGGLQGGQLITIIAPPKTGKSMLGLQTIINVHEAGYDVASQTFEMSNHEQTTRGDAMRAHVSHARLIRGALDPAEEVRYRRMLRKMSGYPNQFMLLDSTAGMTVPAIQGKCELLRPEVLLIDGAYFVTDAKTGEKNTPQAITNVTRDLKNLARRLDIPIIITTQTLLWKMKNGKVSADAIGYSSSFFQDSDVILGLDKDEHNPDVRILRVVEARNCGPVEVDLIWDWNQGRFEEYTAAAAGPAIPIVTANNNTGGRP